MYKLTTIYRLYPFTGIVFILFSMQAIAEDCQVPPGSLLPDLQTVVPKQLGIQNAHQQEVLRFSNGIANLGEGPLWMEPEFPNEGTAPENINQKAFQIFSDAKIIEDDTVPADGIHALGRCEAGEFEFHPNHNHWHIDNVAQFKVCSESSFNKAKNNGTPGNCEPFTLATSTKVTFCLIDWYKLADNTTSSDESRNFFDCETEFQGISPEWVDQYHHSVDDQDIIITGIPEGYYYLMSTTNYAAVFIEEDYSNNSSWVRFIISRDSRGNPKLSVVGDACDDKEYVEQIEQSVENLIPAQPERWKTMVEDMCGGKKTNK